MISTYPKDVILLALGLQLGIRTFQLHTGHLGHTLISAPKICPTDSQHMMFGMMFGNAGWNPTHRNGDEWGMVYDIAIPTLTPKKDGTPIYRLISL